MKTPTKLEIEARARELFLLDSSQHGCASSINPEECELKENGWLSVAQSDLMRDSARSETNEWSMYAKATEKLGEKEEPEVTEEIPFDVREAMDTGFFCCGTSQSGKTNLSKWLVQRLQEAGIIVYVFDVSQAWNSGPIEKIVQIIGNEKTVHFNDSTVFDLSALPVRKKIKFVDTLCGYLYGLHVNGETSHREFIVFEEAQTYLPNGCMRLSTRRDSPCENVLNVVTVGANYGLRFGLITQFPAMVDKTPVKIAQQRYLGWTCEKNDVDYLKGFVGKDWAAKLKNLERGQFVYQLRNKIELIQTEVYGKTHGWGNYEFKIPLLYTNTYK